MLSRKAQEKFQKFRNRAALLNCTAATPTLSTPHRTPHNRQSERVEILKRTPLRPCFSESDMNTPGPNTSLQQMVNDTNEYDDEDDDYSYVATPHQETELQEPHNGLNTFQMQMEIVDLRSQVTFLKGSSSSADDRVELLDLLQEKDEEIASKREELLYMQTRFDDIQAGLKHIEEERHNLRDKSESLESENKELKTHLSNREREVAALSQRCSFQEEKKKESLLLMRKNQELQKILDEARIKCTSLEKQNMEVHVEISENKLVLMSLQDQKLQNEKTNTELTESLASNKLKFDALFKIKEQAQANIVLLTTDKQTCTQQIHEMKDHNTSSQKRIDQLEQLLSDQRNTISSLRTEIITLTQDYKTQMLDIRTYHSQRDEDTITRYKDEIEFMKKEMNHTINNVSSQLEGKTQTITTLELQVSQKLIDIQNLRGQVDSSSNQFSLVSSEKLELDQQMQQLQSQYKEKEGRVISLSTSLQQSQDQCSNLINETTDLTSDMKAMKEKNSEASKKEQELSTLVSSIQEENQQYTKQEHQNQLVISNLRKDKKVIQDSKAVVENESQRAQDELRKEKIELQQKCDAQKKQNEEESIASISCLHNKEKEVNELEESAKIYQDEIDAQKKHIAKFTKQISGIEMEAAEIVSDLETKVQTLRNDCNVMEQKTQTYADEKNQLQNDLQRQMDNILGQKSQNEAEMNQLITVLQEDKKTLEARFETRLKDQHQSITSLVNKLNAKELVIDKSNREIVSLQKDQNLNREKHDNYITTLQHNIEYLEIQSQQLEQKHHEAVESFQNDLAEKEDEMANLHFGMENVHEALEERTKLLGDMVHQNKTLSGDLVEARALVGELQEESDLYLRSKEKVEFLIHKQEAEYQEKEHFYQKKLRVEKQNYAEKFNELGNYKDLYKEAKKLEKELSESEKENVMLRDKVKRQDAFLKRKLQDGKNNNNNMNAGNRRTSVSAGLKMVKANER